MPTVRATRSGAAWCLLLGDDELTVVPGEHGPEDVDRWLSEHAAGRDDLEFVEGANEADFRADFPSVQNGQTR